MGPKSTSGRKRQRVAKHLYRRGSSYEYRRVIPPYARALFRGKGEYVVSFGDVTLNKAADLAAFHRAYCNRLIEEARRKAKPDKGVVQLIRMKRVPDREEVERTVRAWLLNREADFGTSLFGESGDQKTRDIQHIENEVARVAAAKTGQMPLLARWIAEALVEANGWALPSDGELRRFLEDRVARAQYELSKRLAAEQEIGKVHQPTHLMFSPGEFERDREHSQLRSAAISMRAMLDGYLAERKPAAATVKAWTSALNSLIAHLGHDDAARVTPEDIVAWKNALLAESENASGRRSQVTVRHKYLGGVKPVFGWAKRNKLIPENPVAGVTVIVPKRVRTRGTKGFTDAEAKKVLGAAFAIDTDADKSFVAFARRWLPWLCAYTGARVGEMAQLRRQDVVRNEEGIWFLTITPEAGSQKGGFTRQVALHPHLIEQGFIEAINDRSGPLFYDPSRKRKGSAGNPQHKKCAQRVAEWVRHSVGLTDPELQPNHGWRHRFITIARDIRMDEDVRRAITGHRALDEHGDYGDTLIRSSYRWLMEFPRYEIKELSLVGVPSGGVEILQPVATAAE